MWQMVISEAPVVCEWGGGAAVGGAEGSGGGVTLPLSPVCLCRS